MLSTNNSPDEARLSVTDGHLVTREEYGQVTKPYDYRADSINDREHHHLSRMMVRLHGDGLLPRNGLQVLPMTGQIEFQLTFREGHLVRNESHQAGKRRLAPSIFGFWIWYMVSGTLSVVLRAKRARWLGA